eukprot:3014991-Rhodomonas_salina.2
MGPERARGQRVKYHNPPTSAANFSFERTEIRPLFFPHNVQGPRMSFFKLQRTGQCGMTLGYNCKINNVTTCKEPTGARR